MRFISEDILSRKHIRYASEVKHNSCSSLGPWKIATKMGIEASVYVVSKNFYAIWR